FYEFLNLFSGYFELNKGLQMTSDTEFICWNCTALDTSCRGLNVVTMLHNLFLLIHKNNESKPPFVIMEVTPGGKVYDLCIHFKAKALPGILKNDSVLLYFEFEQLRNSLYDMKQRLALLGRK
ncbi:MAG: hypothetical protein QM498_07840, partial [Desulfobacterium sp.]